MVLSLSLIQELLPLLAITNQLIAQLNLSLLDFPQVYHRPQTRIGKTNRNYHQLNQIRRNNLLLLGLVNFKRFEHFEQLIHHRKAPDRQVHKFLGNEFDDLDEFDHRDPVDNLCLLAIVQHLIVDVQLERSLSGPIEGVVHKIVQHVFFGLLYVLEHDRIDVELEVIQLLLDVETEVVSGVGALLKTKRENVGDFLFNVGLDCQFELLLKVQTFIQRKNPLLAHPLCRVLSVKRRRHIHRL